MQVEIVKQNQSYFIRKNCGFSGRRISRSWTEYYTGNHNWSQNKADVKFFCSQQEALDFMERVVCIVEINKK